jgi:hypothetical protein
MVGRLKAGVSLILETIFPSELQELIFDKLLPNKQDGKILAFSPEVALLLLGRKLGVCSNVVFTESALYNSIISGDNINCLKLSPSLKSNNDSTVSLILNTVLCRATIQGNFIQGKNKTRNYPL